MVIPTATFSQEILIVSTDVTISGFTFDVCYANYPVTAKVFANTTEMTGASLFATFTPNLAGGTGSLVFHFSNNTHFDAGGTYAMEIKFSGLNLGTTEIPISTFNAILIPYQLTIDKFEVSLNNASTEFLRYDNLDFYVYFNISGKTPPALYIA